MANIFDVFKYVRPRKTIKSDDFNGLQDSLKASLDGIGAALDAGAPAGHLGVSTPLHVGTAIDAEHATRKDYVDAGIVTSDANAAATAADVLTTNADVVTTAADALTTEDSNLEAGDWADRIEDSLTRTFASGTPTNRAAGNYSALHWAAKTAADAVSTGADATATAADLVATNQDTLDTAADLVATNQDTIDTAADLVATAADVVESEDSNLESGDWANRIEDSLTRTFASGIGTNRAAGNYSALHHAAKAAADLLLTNADVVTTNADVVTTNADAVDTALDKTATNADAVDTALDKTASGASQVAAEDSNLEADDWANRVEDALARTYVAGVPTNRAAGNYSALHHAAKALASENAAAVTAANVGLGLHTMVFPAKSLLPRTTGGASAARIETTTNKINQKVLLFSPTVTEYAQFALKMPKGWDAGVVYVVFNWSHDTTATNYGVRFFAQAVALSDGDALDTAFGTAVGHVADVGGITNDLYATPITTAITIGNTPVKSDYVVFQIYRDVGDVGDTLAIDARLHSLVAFYSMDATTDD